MLEISILARLRPRAPLVFVRARLPMKSVCISLEELNVSRNFFKCLACWSLKESEFTICGRILAWVVYGISRVLPTALFHWTLSRHTYLPFVSHVWDPYQEQQYVCRRLHLTRLDTLWNCLIPSSKCSIRSRSVHGFSWWPLRLLFFTRSLLSGHLGPSPPTSRF